jgi:DNA-directed RNA polymerase subunit RPC12/RpoP
MTVFIVVFIAAVVFFILIRIGVSNKEKEDAAAGIKRETKVTCQACGHVWHYNSRDVMNNLTDAMADLNSVKVFGQKSNSNDLNRCPKCGSRAITEEKVTYKVNQENR